MSYRNGLIVINSNCDINSNAQKMAHDIYNMGTSGVIYCSIKEDLDDKIQNEDVIIIFGGDGTVFSVVQHVINKNIPIIHFPSGTGNGLINSLLKIKNMRVDDDINNTYKYLKDAYLKGDEVKIDTMKINMLNSGKQYHSFLFISCGIFANMDIKSEWLRRLGSIRFTIGAVIELLQYLTIGNSFDAKLEFIDDLGRNLEIEGNFVFFMASNLSNTSAFSITSPHSIPDDGYIYLSYLLAPVSTWELAQILLSLEDGTYINRLNYLRTKKFKLTPKNKSNHLLGKNIYDFDGEEFPTEPIEVEINPKSLRVII